MSSIVPVLNKNDKRAISWINEFRVVLKLAETGNEWTYVGRLADRKADSKITSLNMEGFTRLSHPGAAKACERLADEEVGILEKKNIKPPKKSKETPHYRIVPTLEALERIYRTLHIGVLSVIRQTAWAQGVIAKDLRNYLSSRFKREDGKPIEKAERDEIEFMVRNSTKALAVLLELGSMNSNISIEELRRQMHSAFAFDLITMPQRAFDELGMSVEIAFETRISQMGYSREIRSKITRSPSNLSNDAALDGDAHEG
ncbi:MAG: hypothetical protein QW087_08195 [Methanomassiliicoccales archaeon]